MSDYGGRVMGPNRGICRECSRAGIKLTRSSRTALGRKVREKLKWNITRPSI